VPVGRSSGSTAIEAAMRAIALDSKLAAHVEVVDDLKAVREKL
jgi:hypothetical protein